MIWNPWKHLRLAGALTTIVGAFMQNLSVVLVGLLIQYVGVVAGIDLTERRVQALEEKTEETQ